MEGLLWHEQWSIMCVLGVILKLSGALSGSRSWRPFCPPFLVGKTPASMTFPEFQRADLELIREGAAKKQPEARLKGPEKLINIRS